MILQPGPSPASNRWFSGWHLFGLIVVLLAMTAAAVLFAGGADVASMRMLIRLTGRTSLVLFALAFGAAALAGRSGGPLPRWLRANRRYLGLGFAFSHLVHAVALIAFARVDPPGFAAATNPAMWIFGGLGYLFVVLMAATSFDATAALLGPRRWRMLHLVGGYYLCLIFLQAEAKRAADPFHWPFLALLVALLALRLGGRLVPGRIADPA